MAHCLKNAGLLSVFRENLVLVLSMIRVTWRFCWIPEGITEGSASPSSGVDKLRSTVLEKYNRGYPG